MISEALTDILVLVLLAVVNGIFAMSEIAMVSARGTRLEERAKNGAPGAKAALGTSQNLNQFLSTIQVGITLIGIVAGAFGGATLARRIEGALTEVPLLAPYGHPIGIFVVVVGTTYLTLVIGELVPKQIALSSPEDIAVRVAAPMRFLTKLTYPLVRILSLSTDAVMRLLPIKASNEPVITEEEIRLLMKRGTKAGILERTEMDIVDRTLRLDDFKVEAIMTPDTKIKWLDLEDDHETTLQKAIVGGRTRYPVCRNQLDNVIGAVRVRDLFSQLITSGEQKEIDLEAILFKPVFVAESMSALSVLELFKSNRTHLALVLDEFGAVEGMVTMHDILEEIVGAIPAYKEAEEPFAIQRDDGSWLLDGMMPLVKFKDMMNLPDLPVKEKGDYYTLAGFVVTRVGHIPSSSDSFEWEGYYFEVVDMDRNRVDKVLVVPPDAKAEGGE